MAISVTLHNRSTSRGGGFDSLASTLYIPNFPYYTCAIFHPVNQRGHSGMDVYLKKTLLISRKIMHLALCLQPPNKTLVPQLHAGTDALLRQKKHVVPTGSACVFQHWVMGVLFVTSQRDNFQNLKSTPWKAALARKVKKKKKDFSSLFTDQQEADTEARKLWQVNFASYTMLNARLDRPTECDVQIRHR